jgi:hypothetical protein
MRRLVVRVLLVLRLLKRRGGMKNRLLDWALIFFAPLMLPPQPFNATRTSTNKFMDGRGVRGSGASRMVSSTTFQMLTRSFW